MKWSTDLPEEWDEAPSDPPSHDADPTELVAVTGGYLLKRRNAIERGETTAHGLFSTVAVEVGGESGAVRRDSADARQ